MGNEAERLDGGIEWINPDSGLVVPGETLSARFHDRVPGVFGHRLGFKPLFEGRRLIDGRPVHGFFMNDSDGRPIVGIREVPTPPETDELPL